MADTFLCCSIDGSSDKRKLIIYANDSKGKAANCYARSVNTSFGVQGPFIVTRHDILPDEELTYSYGDYPYEWRSKNEPDVMKDLPSNTTPESYFPRTGN